MLKSHFSEALLRLNDEWNPETHMLRAKDSKDLTPRDWATLWGHRNSLNISNDNFSLNE